MREREVHTNLVFVECEYRHQEFPFVLFDKLLLLRRLRAFYAARAGDVAAQRLEREARLRKAAAANQLIADQQSCCLWFRKKRRLRVIRTAVCVCFFGPAKSDWFLRRFLVRRHVLEV